MVETITPVVHGGRRGRWGMVLALHVLGAGMAAAAFGALLGGAGRLLGAPWGAAGLGAVVVVAALYLAREIFSVRVPVPQLSRQPPERRRTRFAPRPSPVPDGLGLAVAAPPHLPPRSALGVTRAP